MQLLGAVLASALVAYLLTALPLLGRARYRRMVEAIGIDLAARFKFFVRSAIGLVMLCGLVGVVGLVTQKGPGWIGLPKFSGMSTSAYQIASVSVLFGPALIVWFILVRFRHGRRIFRLTNTVKPIVTLFPRTRTERAAWIVLSLCAGLGEEVLYRGFLLAYLMWLFPKTDSIVPILAIGIAFGLAHLYQGWRGVILTAALGAVFTDIVLYTHTLIPVMVVHVILDLRVLAVPSSAFETRNGPITDEGPSIGILEQRPT